MENTCHFRGKCFLCAHLCLLLLVFLPQFASSQKWDGVIVTQSDYQSLRAIKNELVDFKGFLRSWNDSGYGACSGRWAGIKCVKGQVIAIQLPWKGLGGRISEKIGQLQALRKISLHDNVLGGTVPFSLGFLRNLRGVYLFNNRLSVGLTQSPSLVFLSIQQNNLSGPIPDSWGSKGNYSYHLQFLALDHNRISGTIPGSLSKLALLQEISLSHNQLSGAIPYEMGSLSRLQKLDISNNAFSESIPFSFSNLTSLVSLNLEGNRLDSQIPEGFDRLHNLSMLNLKNNQLKGPIPASIGNVSSINQLDLAQNNFSGEIPASLAHLANLTYFNVSYNNLSGSVPSSLAKKFNSSSFVGNLQLCGYSISTQCPSPPPPEILPAPTKGSPKHHHRKLSTKDIILIAAGILLVVLLLLCVILLCCLMKKRSASKEKSGKTTTRGLPGKGEKTGAAAGPEVESGGEMGGKLVHFDGPFLFTADDLLCATAEIMGKSTYGTAYKATLEDGNQVAVKRHPNLIALRAFYIGPKGEKLLVFDYMHKGSLASYLHARGPETTVNWPTRMNIAIGVARGLNHLHTQENIIHGNLTSSNILLDERANAHIADFGLSRLMTAAANTNVIATAGTLGYCAPELAKLKNANTKTDVYSLGVIILELLTGKSPGEPMNGMDLPQWVASIVQEEWTNEVFDLEIMRDAQTIGDELLNTLKLALHCVDPTPAARPEAEQVVQQLEEIKPELAPAAAADDDHDEGAEVPPTTE
ncbi:hypothetical protein OIU85_000983 [Salix viminalis]|uniref:Protein kinase domain-containing protein n=1 Tax=Salix viminalis TaxID=40686 RepID=A0A9Q0ZXH9_SALVM|nr:hypothetical protein OIU85_000983 [Salix viminalis]